MFAAKDLTKFILYAILIFALFKMLFEVSRIEADYQDTKTLAFMAGKDVIMSEASLKSLAVASSNFDKNAVEEEFTTYMDKVFTPKYVRTSTSGGNLIYESDPNSFVGTVNAVVSANPVTKNIHVTFVRRVPLLFPFLPAFEYTVEKDFTLKVGARRLIDPDKHDVTQGKTDVTGSNPTGQPLPVAPGGQPRPRQPVPVGGQPKPSR